jgi:uncharacterized RDD family membrane protein YckC
MSRLVKPHGFTVARMSTRLAARLVDLVVVLLLNLVVNGWLIAQYVREIAPFYDEFVRRFGSSDQAQELQPSPRAENLQIAILVLALALWFAYEVPFTASNGQTLGKRLLHLKVVRVESMEPIGLRRSWRRWNPIALAVPLWICCGFGALLQVLDLMVGVIDRPLHQTIHDKSAGTIVVQVKPPGGATASDRTDS